jgi:hypothetical protein
MIHELVFSHPITDEFQALAALGDKRCKKREDMTHVYNNTTEE